MGTTWLDTEEDMEWLAVAHGVGIARSYTCAILHGNEDYPIKVELFARNDVRCKPTVLHADEAGVLQIISYTAE